ncbi:MAG TPA: class I SAM-dependent methyltransferase [Planctomycetota bacterium]|nr:class I SAM-dependent methyltransferase [Planctomycetota bacterium]
MPESWNEFYSEVDADPRLFLSELVVHEKFVAAILDCRPRTALEVGCGTGRFSVFLSHLGIGVTAIDNDEGVLERAAMISNALHGSVKFAKADAASLPFADDTFDVCFHQGLMEHFSDEQIGEFLREQLRVARAVVFSVPGCYYPTKEFGNERLLSHRKWKRILSSFNVVTSRLYCRHPVGLFRIHRPLMFLAKIEREENDE